MVDFADLIARNEPLNAFADFDESAQGGEGPLAGVTVGVKANVAVQGLPWTAGLEAYRGRIAEKDAKTVACLRDAGAIIIGTQNMEEGALGSKSDNPFYGAVQNPHRNGFSPGGSSGGSAAAVAAGLCDAALGTDTMGSVRIPAAHCGIYGFKPATKAVSQDGLEPADRALDAIGPMARSLDMLQRVAWEMSDTGAQMEDCRGAILVDHGVEVHEDVLAVFDRVLGTMKASPANVSLDHPNSRIRFAGFIHVSHRMAAHLQGVKGLSPHLQKLLTYGPGRAQEKLAQDTQILNDTHAKVRRIVEEHGFLIMPTVPNPAFSHDEPEPAAQADFTCLANIAGLPALTLPAGWTENGLPIGVQLVGRTDYEAGLFAMARYLDLRLDAYRPPANL
ncbi:amidase [Aurantiacibacter gangjinensis]|uniref:Amidase domain-containing protein n=1 Tax=Aurantiacibacter gangjinensis TaxID=502682 RepID=A0A0G9MRU1_9SPHN|nr:amidase [Aurantiacibacter gangjinensis]APE28118.1 Aspartyl-tRNA(Asn) amidotransferase subunit A, Glutamyl-tRNA(Gln) amidotransferase subunit A [Aurantiacibacter gangjinensis]KLE32038.1 hypothetical protein AAW01_11475 [Aurantiacibacter gangjinensis]